MKIAYFLGHVKMGRGERFRGPEAAAHSRWEGNRYNSYLSTKSARQRSK